MQYEFTVEHIICDASDDEYEIFRAAVLKRLVRAASGGCPLEYYAAWTLTNFLADTTDDNTVIRTSCSELPYYSEALATEAIDMDEADMNAALEMVSSMEVAREGFFILKSPPKVPKYFLEDF